MTFRRSAGLPFDDDYILYSEDVHFSRNTRLQGGKNFLIPSSVCYHEGEGSSKNFKEKTFYQQRNRLMNLFIFYEKRTLLKLLPLLAFNIFATGMKDFPYRLKANFWLLRNWRVVGKKRKEMQALRKIPDSEMTPLLSGKFFDGFPILNRLYLAYLRIVGVRTIEMEA